MCYKVVEVHDECDHETKNLIPCEGMMDEGTCTAKPEDTKDRIGKATTPCQKCQDEQADDAALEEALKKIAEDPALAPAPKTAIKPAGDLGTFKYRNRWTKCGHCTDPQESGVERQHEGDPEWLDFSQEGHCNGCSILHPRVYAERRAQGLLDGDDPYNALKGDLQPAAGGSANAGAGTKDPAFHIPDDEDDGGRHFVPSRSPSPDQIPTITRGKGKGRASKPEETYASRHGAAEPAVPEYESDAEREDESTVHSGDEGHTEGVKPGKSKAPKYGSSDEEDNDEESDDGEDDDEEEEPHPRGRKITKHAIGSGSRGSSSKSGTQATRRHRARSSSSNYSQGEEDGPPDWSSQPPPGSPPPPMASGALRPPPRNSARRNARPSAED